MTSHLRTESNTFASRAIKHAPTGLLQRKCACGNQTLAGGECEACGTKRINLQTRAVDNQSENAEVPPIVHEVLRSTGQPLDQATRAFMEPRFGHDFSQVRVHTDAKAAESAGAVNAVAYTVGRDVVFGVRQYAPDTNDGRRLLAHELAHVVQQSSSSQRTTSDIDKGSADPLEQAAERAAHDVLAANHAGSVLLQTSLLPTRPLIQRYTVLGTLDCGEVVDWLNNNSPYSPEWAQTHCTYSFNGQLRISPPDTSGGGVRLTVTGHDGLTVSVNCPVDRPQWSPSPRTNRAAEVAAWNSMRATLDAHEQQHRAIGQTWRTTLQTRFRTVDFTVTGTDRTDAMNQVRQTISSMQQQWTADAQAAQDAIDPFSGAILTCP